MKHASPLFWHVFAVTLVLGGILVIAGLAFGWDSSWDEELAGRPDPGVLARGLQLLVTAVLFALPPLGGFGLARAVQRLVGAVEFHWGFALLGMLLCVPVLFLVAAVTSEPEFVMFFPLHVFCLVLGKGLYQLAEIRRAAAGRSAPGDTEVSR